jgi:hypothetical protein
MQIKKLFIAVLMLSLTWRRGLRWARALLSGLKEDDLLTLIKMMLMIQTPEEQEGRWMMRAGEGCFPSAMCLLLLHSLGAPCHFGACLLLSRSYKLKTSSPVSLSLEILVATLALGGVFIFFYVLL